ncbi:hypothetical protein BBD42_13060 [Paenibacillus sp. BIHB 4019]|uniref:Phage ABA sandwich domain-containing protein n=1 Tax=Paenibacillus sp. BIHB 4019 TaxID=1870819 RepID=A0A1B2DHV4_9BACL|nr:hypothetical protein [Paenibacillus sp. BIHB 4019]ANY67300.1 hypothetical protein BBD42_13060 [Paenibacillus sp. BIHB 4019]
MNWEQVMGLESGIETDVLIAEMIFGLEVDARFSIHLKDGVWEPLSKYSSDISAAWLVVQHFVQRDCEVDVRYSGEWECSIDTPSISSTGSGNAAPTAICRAALLITTIRG